MYSFKRWFSWCVMCVLCFVIAGCSQQGSFQSTDVTGTQLGTQFALKDTSGTPRTIKDFAGKVVVLFFGFTQCPDFCPTTMLKMQQVMKLLGEDAQQVQVLFVTVDPERDTPDILQAYVRGFDERFEGMWGSLEDTRKVADDFRVHYKKVFSNSSYTMEHTASTYIFDQQGQFRLVASYNLTAEQIAQDIRALLQK